MCGFWSGRARARSSDLGRRTEAGTSAAPTSRAGRSITSRARPPTRTGCTRRSPAAGSARSSSAPMTAARPGSRWATNSSTTASPGTHQWYDGTPHPWEFKRVWHLEPSLDRPRHGLRRRRGRRPVPLDRRRAALAGTPRPARPRLGAVLAAGRGRDVPAHDHPGPDRPRRGCSSRSRPRACSGPTTPARPGGRSTAACSPSASPTRPPRSATASTGSRCTPPARTCCSCRSTGTSCAATTRASPGARSAATCRPTSGSRSTCTRTSRRPSTSSRSRATPSTSRPTGSCASTAAAPAATSGRR